MSLHELICTEVWGGNGNVFADLVIPGLTGVIYSNACGGDKGGDPDETFAAWESALALPGVRGLTVGRTLLYPVDGNVEAAVDTAARLVHPHTK